MATGKNEKLRCREKIKKGEGKKKKIAVVAFRMPCPAHKTRGIAIDLY